MEFVKRILILLLTLQARLMLWRFNPTIIAVTGNLGKTTTKDAIYAALKDSVLIRKNEKSFNSDIGVPLTILNLKNPWNSVWRWVWTLALGKWRVLFTWTYPNYLVLEVGADAPGDIARISSWLKPHIIVYTGVPETPVHAAYFHSVEALVAEKMSIFSYLRPGGSAIVNGEDKHLAQIPSSIPLKRFFGPNPDLDVATMDIAYEADIPVGTSVTFSDGSELVLRGTLGLPRVAAALAALLVAETIGADHEQALVGLEGWDPAPGRLRLIEGKNNAVIIDDSYNASPKAMIEALRILKAVHGNRKIAVLGDMRELGALSKEAHEKVGHAVVGVADMLVTVGQESHVLADAARSAGFLGPIHQYGYDMSEEVGKFLAGIIQQGDVVLMKGSQNHVRLERVVKALMAHPEHAGKLLVRQEPEWQVRA